jgi:hypothetical protein
MEVGSGKFCTTGNAQNCGFIVENSEPLSIH